MERAEAKPSIYADIRQVGKRFSPHGTCRGKAPVLLSSRQYCGFSPHGTCRGKASLIWSATNATSSVLCYTKGLRFSPHGTCRGKDTAPQPSRPYSLIQSTWNVPRQSPPGRPASLRKSRFSPHGTCRGKVLRRLGCTIQSTWNVPRQSPLAD